MTNSIVWDLKKLWNEKGTHFCYKIHAANFPKLDEEKVSKNVAERVMNGVSIMKPLPYQLFLHFNENPTCGATLLSPNIALTAFHCIVDHSSGIFERMLPIDEFQVYAGVYESKLENNKNVQNVEFLKHLKSILRTTPDTTLFRILLYSFWMNH